MRAQLAAAEREQGKHQNRAPWGAEERWKKMGMRKQSREMNEWRLMGLRGGSGKWLQVQKEHFYL
jgi:hypothetical protein